jgi:hypothetical protein
LREAEEEDEKPKKTVGPVRKLPSVKAQAMTKRRCDLSSAC